METLLSSPCQLGLKVVLRYHSVSSYTCSYVGFTSTDCTVENLLQKCIVSG